jgi:hypothetical protein
MDRSVFEEDQVRAFSQEVSIIIAVDTDSPVLAMVGEGLICLRKT